MSFRPFQTTAEGTFSAQPSGAGEKLVAVSTDASDTVNIVITGNSTPASETLALSTDGKIERETAATFDSLTALSASATLTGYVSVYGQGTAGVGDIRLDSVPAGAETLVIGLTGYTQTYTYRQPAAFTIQTVAASALADSDYFDIAIGGTTNRFWYEIDGAGGVAPADPGTLTKVSILSTDTAADVATATEAAMETTITGWSFSVSSSTITAAKDVLGTATLTFTDGAAAAATGFTYTAIGTGTADAANQIRTGYTNTGEAATTTDVALWTQYAVNATGGTAGTHYGTATAANSYLSASAASGVVTLTDRIACYRSLGWVVTSPASGEARTIAGGAYGTLLALITADEFIQSSQIFDNADLADNTLLALWADATDAIFVNGQPSTLRLQINNVTTAVTVTLQASDDGTTWYDISGTSALTGTVAGTASAYVLTGTSTLFTTELRVGEKITISGYTYTVASIASATSLYTVEPLATSPSGTSVVKLLPVQIASLKNNSQFIPVPPVEYARLNFTANVNTTDSKLHAGLII